MQTALGTAFMAVKGFAAPEVEHAYTRAHELCHHIGGSPHLFRVLWGLRLFCLLRAEPRTVYMLGKQLFSLAQRVQDPALLLTAHIAVGDKLFHIGELVRVQSYLEQAVALYSPSNIVRSPFSLPWLISAWRLSPLRP
jgi:hypothetical protein